MFPPLLNKGGTASSHDQMIVSLFFHHLQLLILPLSLFVLSSFVHAADFSGLVISILDGDTIEVLYNNHAERIRLRGIDCPEKGQAYGQKAKHAASDLVFGKEVTLHTFGKDKYGRTIGEVLLSDGTNVNQELVKEGWCWWYRKYEPGNTELERLEKEAREGKKGLWVDPAPVPPWVYRKAKRGQSINLSDLIPLDGETDGSASTRSPPAFGERSPLLGASEQSPASFPLTSPYPVIGNRRSHIYHRPDCPNYSQIAPRNRVAFNSTTEAEEAGYRVAGNCP